MYSNVDYKNISKQKIAMYGGSFNPVHTGHIQLAEYFVSELELDKLLLIPDSKPPHKNDKEMISENHRYNMCMLASENVKNIQVSDIEIKRQGKSYTVDTLRQLGNIYKNTQLYLIMGADMFITLHTWKEYREILKQAVVCAVPRDKDSVNTLIDYSKTLESKGLRCIISDKMMMNISSTEIRSCIKQGKSIAGMVDRKVEDYIYKNSLYMR